MVDNIVCVNTQTNGQPPLPKVTIILKPSRLCIDGCLPIHPGACADKYQITFSGVIPFFAQVQRIACIARSNLGGLTLFPSAAGKFDCFAFVTLSLGSRGRWLALFANVVFIG